jgi:iron complex transport system substrate-binding protein
VKKIALVLLVLTLLAALVSACAEQTTATATIVDDLGRPVNIEDVPQRIVSLAPSITEILFALDLGDRVVGVTDYCDYPEEAEAKPKVGAPFPGFSIEDIVKLEPSLVLSIAGAVISELENVGLTVVVLQPRDFAGIYRDIEIVGEITGKVKEAEEIVNDMKDRVDAVVAKTVKITEKPTVFYEVDASWDVNKPWTVGYNTFQDDLINLAGGKNMAAGRSGWYEISIEEILAADPDLIILEDYQFGVTPDDVANRSVWHELTAVGEGKVYPIIDPNLTSRQGPRIVDGLEEIARIIHPELFE